jgi:exopolysaccharide biosynthesis polyprenyl glycosylphosphotransferase
MNSTSRLLIKIIYIAIDVVVIVLSIYLACLWREDLIPFTVTLKNIFFLNSNPYRFLFTFWLIITVLQLNMRDLYQTRREISEGMEIDVVIKSVVVASILVALSIFFFKFKDFPRSIFLVGTGLNIFFLSAWRAIKRHFVLYMVSKGYNNFNALIIGAGNVGVALAQSIKERPHLGINIIGFLDNEHEGYADEEEKFPILGHLDEFRRIVREEFINKVFITSYPDTYSFLKLLKLANEMGVAIRVVPQGFELIDGEFDKYNIGIIPVLEYSNGKNVRKLFGKRLFDFVMALLIMIPLLPVFLIIALAIKLNSPGPVFYFSLRYGRNGRKFRMIKFRSMVTNAEEQLSKYLDQNDADGPIFKMKNDPRVTKIGAFLRKYSLDELPQMINVLKGDMSLVGPRPLPIEQVWKHDHLQLARLDVRPGITGLWQIRGRSDVSYSRLLRWDLWYIKNWSFWLDLNILLQTIPVVIKGRGAY